MGKSAQNGCDKICHIEYLPLFACPPLRPSRHANFYVLLLYTRIIFDSNYELPPVSHRIQLYMSMFPGILRSTKVHSHVCHGGQFSMQNIMMHAHLCIMQTGTGLVMQQAQDWSCKCTGHANAKGHIITRPWSSAVVNHANLDKAGESLVLTPLTYTLQSSLFATHLSASLPMVEMPS